MGGTSDILSFPLCPPPNDDHDPRQVFKGFIEGRKDRRKEGKEGRMEGRKEMLYLTTYSSQLKQTRFKKNAI